MTDQGFAPSPEQEQELQEAKERAGTFLGAARVAAFNGWTLGFFAVVSLLSGLFSPTGLLVGLGLAVVARNELVGRGRVRSFDPSGLQMLWRNQLGLMALIIVYCVWRMYRSVAAPAPELVELTELLGGDTGSLVQSLMLTLYAAVIVATVICQGLNARYYFVRIARLEDFVRNTPSWVLDLQRSLIQ